MDSDIVAEMEGYVQTAEDFIQKNYLESANELYDKALRCPLNPREHPLAWQLKIAILAKVKGQPEATNSALEYEATLKDGEYPFDVKELTAILLGEHHSKMENYEKASHWFKIIQIISPDEKTRIEGHKLEVANERLSRTVERRPSRPVGVASLAEVVQEDINPELQEFQGVPPPQEEKKEVLEFSISNSYEIEETVENRLYLARSKTFVKTSGYLAEGLEEIISLRDGVNPNPHILRVDEIIKHDSEKFLLCEKVTSIDDFFKKKAKLFSKELGKKQWWTDIESDMQRLLRDVIMGLIILFSSGRCCGDLNKSLFVTTQHGRGRILPSLDPSSEPRHDINALRLKIHRIIGLPFGETKVNFDEYGLPKELADLLLTFFTNKMKNVPPQWFVYHPYVWTVYERFEFIQGLRFALKRDDICSFNLNDMFERLCGDTYGSMVSGIKWPLRIIDGPFKSVYDYPNAAPYVRALDIQRYVNAAFVHVNDHASAVDGVKKVVYTFRETEEYLRNFFPTVYVDLRKSLLEYANSESKMAAYLLEFSTHF
ncbi:hypothetical protein RND81_02G131000 [Saponaria officinalis]|uniref:Uncharacterized protein n=1 Tax=Saponaria officinalis TaxID=3572 RepID=A0AAW1MPS1_SAPOF